MAEKLKNIENTANKPLKNFIGERAYKAIKNISHAIDQQALRSALVILQNARAIFADLSEYEIKSLCAEISNNNSATRILSKSA